MCAINAAADDAAPPLRYRVDDLLVDAGRRCVTRDSVELDVTGRSFELLLSLVRAAPNALSLDQLMNEVWRGMVVNQETVTQRVKILRQALGDAPEQPRYVANVRGHGYRLLPQVTLVTTEASEPMPGLPPTLQVSRKSWRVAGASLTLIVLLAAAAGWFIRKNTQVPAVARDSVAVLPFVNMTGDVTKEYLADGMAEELINTLARVPGLKVPARTSSFVYKGRNVSVRDIAKDLQVSTILEGSVRTAGQRIRITAQLIDAQNGLHLWSQTYDEEFADLFKLQDKLASQIAQALQPNLSGAVTQAIAQTQPTKDVEAYNLYLQGVSLVQRTSEQNAARAVEYFQQAIDRDPKFARAYAMMAEAQAGWAALTGSDEHAAAADRAARQALALDPNLADAHLVLAASSKQPAERHAHLIAALQLAANDSELHVQVAAGWGWIGHIREVSEEMQRAYNLAPANPRVAAWIAFGHAVTAQPEAKKYVEIAADLGFPRESLPLSFVYWLDALHARRYSQAAELFIKEFDSRDPEQARTVEVTRLVYAALADPSQRDQAFDARARLYPAKRAAVKDVGPCLMSSFNYALLGATDSAYALIDQCRPQPGTRLSPTTTTFSIYLWLPELRAFRQDARFQTLATRLGLMDAWLQFGPPDDCDLKDGKLTCH